MGQGGASLFFWLDTRLLKNVGDNRLHAWKGGRGAGYPNILMVISYIPRYLMKFDIFGKIEGLGELFILAGNFKFSNSYIFGT